jgi:type VI secretion system secreted protein VgrG
MSMLELSFESGEDSLSVRRFSVREGLSSLFEISIEARSPNEDIDLSAIIGRGATLRMVAGTRHLARDARLWGGVCNHIELEQAEESGLSTYRLRIVPRLWLLTQRRNHRTFQHLSIPEIAGKLLAEWRIDPVWKIDPAAHPRLELRTQYGESDYVFLTRLLEEAGVTFTFDDEDGKGTRLVLHDRPHAGEPRAGGPVLYVDNPNQSAEREYVTRLRLSHDVQPVRYTIRDFDFRRNPEYPLLGEASISPPPEPMLEQYHYQPGAFLIEGGQRGDTPVADDKGVARHDDRAGKALAERSLEAAQGGRRTVSFKTNVIDLAPGVVFTVGHHPRADLGSDRKLLATELTIEGAPGEEWTTTGRAVFADVPHRPARTTPKPQVHSVQSALVVGPKGEEIHTDEFGRVRVQFHWDREGKHDEHSFCWVRVSQGWAGSGFGMIAIPRVGQEVLVGFLGGDPDQPVVVGRLYNNTARVPYKLPENKAVSGWKSDSSPGSGGFNEIRFEDGKGRELVHVQAERNLSKLVKVDEKEVTGRERVIEVGKRLVLTTGEAAIVLDGPHIWIEAGGRLMLDGGPEEVDEPEADSGEEQPETGADATGREHYSDGVDLKGSPEFRARARQALDRLAKTRTGSGLLRKIAKTDHVVTVVETEAKNGFCKAEQPADAARRPDRRAGKGSPSTVAFNPSFNPGGAPSELVLAYGLSHARMNALGLREPGRTGATKDADLMAIGLPPFAEGVATENSLRRDLGLPSRKHY